MQSIFSEVIKKQSHKFTVFYNRDRSPVRHATAGEDVIKNLFKVCCGILNLNLHQRGINQIDDEMLGTYLDSIDFEL